MPSITVHSISRYLRDHSPIPASLRVVSRHQRVVNLEDARGMLLALAHPSVGNGPFHLVLAKEVAFDGLTPGVMGYWDGERLMVGSWQIDVSSAASWDPYLIRSHRPIPDSSWRMARRCVSTLLATLPLQADIDVPIWARLQEGVARLDIAQQAGGDVAAREAASLIVGLGPGLTPAGDDVLLGFMARWWMQHSVTRNPSSIIHDLKPVWEEKGKTTRISRAWLNHAAAGRFAEPWHELYAAMTMGDENAICRAIARIAKTGATSGRLALLGAFSLP